MEVFWEHTFLGCREVLGMLIYGSLKVFLGGFINDLKMEILGYLKAIK